MKLKELSGLMKTKKKTVGRNVLLDSAFELYNMLLEIYRNQFSKFKHDKK